MAEVLIAGGGVIGLSIAWRAAQRGFDVTLADPAPGAGASHAAAGMLTPVSEAAFTEKELYGLGAASLERYPAFAAELTAATGLPTGFRLTGTLQVGYDHDDLAVIDELNHRVKNTLATVQAIATQSLRGDDVPGAARERFMARLVAEGLTNAEIADRLFLSPSTVAQHVNSARRKVNAASRTALAVRVAEGGLD